MKQFVRAVGLVMGASVFLAGCGDDKSTGGGPALAGSAGLGASGGQEAEDQGGATQTTGSAEAGEAANRRTDSQGGVAANNRAGAGGATTQPGRSGIAGSISDAGSADHPAQGGSAGAAEASGGSGEPGQAGAQDHPSTGGSSGTVCTRGDTRTCVGPGGCRGAQACLRDGSGWDACDCGAGTAGAAGSASAGSAGQATGGGVATGGTGGGSSGGTGGGSSGGTGGGSSGGTGGGSSGGTGGGSSGTGGSGGCSASLDTDGDGLDDCEELDGWNVTVYDLAGVSSLIHVTSDPTVPDTDLDGLDDQFEKVHRYDPRSDDTDDDGLSDYDELYLHNSNPTKEDSDGDCRGDARMGDWSEVNVYHTSPILSDTDGDAPSPTGLGDKDDYDEAIKYGSQPGNNPLLAEIATMEFDFVGDLLVSLVGSASAGCEIGSETYQAVLTSETSSYASSYSSTVASLTTHSKDAKSASVSLFPPNVSFGGSTTTTSQATLRSHTTSFSVASSNQVSQEFSRLDSQSCFSNLTTDGATITMPFTLSNVGEVSFTLQDMSIGVRMRDPNDPEHFVSLGNVNPVDHPITPDSPVTLTAELTTHDPLLARRLLANPSGLSFELEDATLTDELGRDFAYISNTTLNQTAVIEIDFGQAGADLGMNPSAQQFLVATNVNVEVDPDNPLAPPTFRGITVQEAMEIIGYGIATQSECHDELVCSGRVCFTHNVCSPRRLTGINGLEADADTRAFWYVEGSGTGVSDPDTDFEDIVLHAGDHLLLAYISDQDDDGLFTPEEALYGSDPDDADTDGDVINDGDEAHSDERSPIIAEFPGRYVAQVAANAASALVLLDNGTLWGFGSNAFGQLGLGSERVGQNVAVPTRVGTDSTWVYVATHVPASATGRGTSFGVRSDGSLWAWGSNYYGMLGLGRTSEASVASPTRVGSGLDWSRVYVGETHVLALKQDGALYSWGSDDNGQLGVTTATSPCPGDTSVLACAGTPQHVGSSSWREVAAGSFFSLGILASDDSLWSWGSDSMGQLGNGPALSSNVSAPTQISSSFHWRQVTAGYRIALATRYNSTGDTVDLCSWGLNSERRIGRETTETCSGGYPCATAPGLLLSGSGETATTGPWWIAADVNNGFALRGDTVPQVFDWGSGTSNRLGRSTATAECGGTGTALGCYANLVDTVTSSAAWRGLAPWHVVDSDGQLWVWGPNSYGQLGLGSYSTAQSVPVIVPAQPPL
jgi:alpha-tubulin suppressor-like RCC1 family protein